MPSRARKAAAQASLPQRRKNHLINGDFQISARHGTNKVISTSVPINSDDTYCLPDRWLLLSDGNDIVDPQLVDVTSPDNAKYSLALEVETVDKKFGVVQIITNQNSVPIIGNTVTLSFQAKVSNTTRLDDVRAAIVTWSGTADAPTSDLVNAWNGADANFSVVTNWTLENTPANLSVTTSWAKYSVTGALDASSGKNVAVMIWSNSVDNDADDILYIGQCQLELGNVATDFEFVNRDNEGQLCLAHYYDSRNSYTSGQDMYNGTTKVVTYHAAGMMQMWGWNIGAANQYRWLTETNPTMMHKTPTLTLFDSAGTSGKISRWTSTGGGLANGNDPYGTVVTAARFHINTWTSLGDTYGWHAMVVLEAEL